MSTVTTPASSGEEIQRQMRQVRRELGEDVQEIVANARTMTDWKHYVRTYPWACLGAAAVAGYLIVPSRQRVVSPDPQALAAALKDQKIVVQSAPAKAEAKATLRGQIVGMVTGALFQAGAAALKQYAARQLAEALARNGSPPMNRPDELG
jgi:TctA family transporter